MGAVIRTCYTCVVPVDSADEETACSKEELTDFERACLRGLQRTSLVVFAMFLVNVGVSVYVYEMGDVDEEYFLAGLITFVPMLPQFVLSNRIAATTMGRKPVTLSWFRLTLIFFMLLNLIRLFMNNSITTLKCDLVKESFEDGTKPSTAACSLVVQLLGQFSIIIYVVFTLFQVSIVVKLENSYRRRALQAWALRLSEGSTVGLTLLQM
ncbi:hypothetical protein TrST_g703 [Triparma strigata]|uniref:Uncharacterized protein n=2 Tax=Triparma TaxID=722752 RepID=A0A9W7ENJ3_9STRA|nr:hypothetical protein TrST_g703 [Triparma strigata]